MPLEAQRGGMGRPWINRGRAQAIELGYLSLMSGAGQWTQSRAKAKLGPLNSGEKERALESQGLRSA